MIFCLFVFLIKITIYFTIIAHERKTIDVFFLTPRESGESFILVELITIRSVTV